LDLNSELDLLDIPEPMTFEVPTSGVCTRFSLIQHSRKTQELTLSKEAYFWKLWVQHMFTSCILDESQLKHIIASETLSKL